MNFKVTNVVEFAPDDFSVENYSELLEAGTWPQHWGEVLDSHGLRAISPGSWFVAISQFGTHDSFVHLLCSHLECNSYEDLAFPDDLDELGVINGGCAFEHLGSVQIDPGCCCDLSDLSQWKNVFENGGGPVAVGHAEHHLRVVGQSVEIIPDGLRVSSTEFRSGLESAEIELNRFANELEAFLQNSKFHKRASEIAKTLVFGYSSV